MTASDPDLPTGQHLVLKRKANGKIASRKDQLQKAAQLKAVQLTDDGHGGGIVSLLLPKSAKESNQIASIGEIYNASTVAGRNGQKTKAKGKRTVQQELDEAIQNHNLFASLAVLYEAHIGPDPGPHQTGGREIAGWIRGELAKNNSPTFLAVGRLAPILLEVDRSLRWWTDAFTQRRKTQS